MPSQVVKSFAKKSGKSVDTIEGYWNDCKESVDAPKDSDMYWAKVNNCTQYKAGLKDKPKEESIVLLKEIIKDLVEEVLYNE